MDTLQILLFLTAVFGVNAKESQTIRYANQLINKYSSSSKLNQDEFRELFEDLSRKEELSLRKPNVHEGVALTLNSEDNSITNSSNITCLNADSIFHHFENNTMIDGPALVAALPLVIVNIENCKLLEEKVDHIIHHKKSRPSSGEVWGYGLGFAVLVCLISNLGAFLAPVMNTKIFEQLLMFLVAMAVGTLAATALLVLIPEALNLMAYKEIKDEYISKMSTVCAALLFFFLSERTIKSLVQSKRDRVTKETIIDVPEGNDKMFSNSSSEIEALEYNTADDSNGNLVQHGHSHHHVVKEGESMISTVAYIIVVGDGLHKFVDGLSVGAAFSENMLTGMTVAVAMICEEIAHEIGDIAILLHSGMSMKRALVCNSIAALFCFAGVVVGIVLGETTSANHWIFAIAGGIFLYVALVDMLPEMGAAAESAIKKNVSPLFVTFIQVVGLMFGYLVIFLVAKYVGNIEL